MRAATIIALAAALALAPAAMAQRPEIRQTPPDAVLQQAAPTLDGTWHVVTPHGGQLTIAAQPGFALTGVYVAAPCNGAYTAQNAFVLFCHSQGLGTFVFNGVMRPVIPVLTQRRSSADVAFRQYELYGEAREPLLGPGGDLGPVQEFRATR